MANTEKDQRGEDEEASVAEHSTARPEQNLVLAMLGGPVMMRFCLPTVREFLFSKLPLKGFKVTFDKDPQKYLQGGPTMKMPGH